MVEGMPGREPCPACGKMLKPLTPKVKARDLRLRWEILAYNIEDAPEHPAGTRRHACTPSPAATAALAPR
jgi:hypothetical protein